MLSDRTLKLLKRLDEAKRLIDEHRPLSRSVLERLHEQMVLEWTYNSNAIEGNTLTIKETKLALQDGITVRNKPLKDYLEAINHKNAIDFVEELASQKTKITERNIREIHSLVLKDIDKDYAGIYRDINVRISGSKHTPPEHFQVKELMRTFAKKRLSTKEHAVVEAALAHFELVSIHPFVDGNGRTARLLMNLVLIKKGFFPAVILKNDRLKYYDVLERGHSGDIDDFVFFIGRSLERTVYLYFEAIPKIKANFITLKQASEISTYSVDYLNIMARRGTIPAFKLKRNWVVSKEAFLKYVKSKK
ncbi:MAG: Fic family protein [Bdellovibrionales bacterium]|nr:Fic family protein [Bdellovibrionales bacterium]